MRPPLIILAGGRGTRLGELTTSTSKCMIDIEGKPFLHWLLQHYINQGFEHITINTGYASSSITSYVWSDLIGYYDIKYAKDHNLKSGFQNGTAWFYSPKSIVTTGHIVVNGDTWIQEPLPLYTDSPWILSCNDVDAGAQFVSRGKIKIFSTPQFFDIGTLKGLSQFRRYFKTHLYNALKKG
jgi:hypothetical protein